MPKIKLPGGFYEIIHSETDYYPVGKEAFEAIVGFVMSHKDDIEAEINDFGDLKPVWNWFNRNC